MLLKKVRALEKKIGEHERAAGGSLAELQERHAASTARMARDGRRAREAIGIFEAIDDALSLRISKLSELDHRLEQLVNTKFRSYMWKKGHSGVIKLDRRAKSLQLKVQIGSKGSREGGAVKDLKQASPLVLLPPAACLPPCSRCKPPWLGVRRQGPPPPPGPGSPFCAPLHQTVSAHLFPC
jgi:hypothetical protein